MQIVYVILTCFKVMHLAMGREDQVHVYIPLRHHLHRSLPPLCHLDLQHYHHHQDAEICLDFYAWFFYVKEYSCDLNPGLYIMNLSPKMAKGIFKTIRLINNSLMDLHCNFLLLYHLC